MNFKIDCKIYPRRVHVFFEDNLDLAKQAYEKYYRCELGVNMNTFQALTVFPTDTSKFNTVVIFLSKSSKSLLEDIHHESIHAATWILDNVGVPISQHNDEALAYFSTYIFTNVQVKLIEWKIK